MSKYIIEIYKVPLIWAQKVKNVNRLNRHCGDDGKVVGPFMTGYEAARAIKIKTEGVANVLKGYSQTTYGYRLYYDGEVTLEFKIPNVKYAKERGLIPDIKKQTLSNIQENMTKVGFYIVEIGELDGAKTKIKTRCCNVGCYGIIEKNYTSYISHENPPICKKCSSILTSIKIKENGKKLLYDIRPDLKKYYFPEDNYGIEINEIPHASSKGIFLRCDMCNRLQMEKEAIPPSKYTRLKRNGKGFNSNFKCSYCHSLAVKFPRLIEEWHERNEKSPYDYSYGSRMRAWWRCSKGHEWEAMIGSRTGTYKSGCPQCSCSKGEKAIAQTLDELKIKYVAEYPARIGGTTRFFDLYLPEFNLFLEVHGLQHYESTRHFQSDIKKQQKIDLQKQRYAEKHGHYMCVDYREHDSDLVVDRFLKQFLVFVQENEEAS
ncbi:zinc-ribbon domain-containing protein [Bacillus cereus]